MPMTPSDDGPPVALITGAGSGIGRSTAKLLAASGWRLGLLGRTASKLETTIEAFAEGHPEALPLACDLEDSDEVIRSVKRLIAAFGRFDAAINIAGGTTQVPIDALDAQSIHSMLAQNLVGHMLIVSTAWPELVRNSGCVVNISSMASIDPFMHFTAYAASKAGLDSLTRSIMAEAGETGIRAFTRNPGVVETPLLRRLFDESVVATEVTLAPEVIAEEILACINGDRDHRVGEHFPMVHPLDP